MMTGLRVKRRDLGPRLFTRIDHSRSTTAGWTGTYTAAGEINEDGGVRRFDEPRSMDEFALPSPTPGEDATPPVTDPFCPALAAVACGVQGLLSRLRMQK